MRVFVRAFVRACVCVCVCVRVCVLAQGDEKIGAILSNINCVCVCVCVCMCVLVWSGGLGCGALLHRPMKLLHCARHCYRALLALRRSCALAALPSPLTCSQNTS